VAQSPQQFAYQAVVRDNNNQLLSNRTIGIRVSIVKDSANGQSAYTETHTPKTNTQGIIQLNIGGGTAVSGSFTSVPWSSGKLFVKTEMDLQGGTNYTIIGTTQLLSVPYALYSSDVLVRKSGDTVTIGSSKLIIPGSQLLPGAAPASLSNGLIAYYPFNGNANDESGNGRNASLIGANFTLDRKNTVNSAIELKGMDWVTLPSIPINGSGARSISFWVRFSNVSDNTTSNNMFSFGTTQQSSAFNLRLHKGRLNLMGFNNDYENLNRIPLEKNIWYHITVTYENGLLKFILNGSTFETFQTNPILSTVGNSNFIGKSNHVGWEYFLIGMVDEFRIYDRVLNQEEITFLANN
jgi:hypothetical protein